MRFLSLAVAALLSVSAKNNLANQLTSLKSMVQATGEWETNNMIDVISARKVELEGALKDKTMSKAEVADELRYLLQLVRDVEQNNKAAAVTTLTARKTSLVNLKEETKATEEVEKDKDGNLKKDEGLDYYEKAVKEAQKKVDDQTKVVEEKQKAFDDWLNEEQEDDADKKNSELSEEDQHKSQEYKDLDDAKDQLTVYNAALKTAKFAKEHGSAAIPIIISVAAIALIGGGCYCYRKNKSENEGGEREDKKLFKKVFKGKVQKKAAKEEIIPTFAVPAEEQIWDSYKTIHKFT